MLPNELSIKAERFNGNFLLEFQFQLGLVTNIYNCLNFSNFKRILIESCDKDANKKISFVKRAKNGLGGAKHS